MNRKLFGAALAAVFAAPWLPKVKLDPQAIVKRLLDREVTRLQPFFFIIPKADGGEHMFFEEHNYMSALVRAQVLAHTFGQATVGVVDREMQSFVYDRGARPI